MSDSEFQDAIASMAPDFGLTIDPEVLDRFCRHFDLLRTWNRKLNLTRVIAPADAARFHFLESAFLTTVVRGSDVSACRIVDVGSGAGFPGIPLACMWLDSEFVLVEPNEKRAVFLKEAVRRLELTKVTVEIRRYDAERVRSSDFLVSRALEGLEQLLDSIVLSPAEYIALFTTSDVLSRARGLSGRTATEVAIPGTLNRRIGVLRA